MLYTPWYAVMLKWDLFRTNNLRTQRCLITSLCCLTTVRRELQSLSLCLRIATLWSFSSYLLPCLELPWSLVMVFSPLACLVSLILVIFSLFVYAMRFFFFCFFQSRKRSIKKIQINYKKKNAVFFLCIFTMRQTYEIMFHLFAVLSAVGGIRQATSEITDGK